MSVKNSRHQSVVNRQCDQEYSEDHWLQRFEAKIQKNSVQPRDRALFDQISSIMDNHKSKYPSVQAKVDDMMARSGLSAYLQNVKTSEKQTEDAPVKTAADNQQANDKLPQIIQDKPTILRTLQNIIKDTKGNISVPAVISRLHSLHAQDVSDDSLWEDDKLIRLVSHYNLKAKQDNPGSYENYDNLGQTDHSTADSDIDPSNTDAFNSLMPAKI